jgi:hypothetical protein
MNLVARLASPKGAHNVSPTVRAGVQEQEDLLKSLSVARTETQRKREGISSRDEIFFSATSASCNNKG